MPSVWSRSSLPIRCDRSAHPPERASASLARTLCDSASIQPSAASATERSVAPTVMNTTTSAAVQAATSTPS